MWVTILLVAFAVCGLQADHLCLDGDTPSWYPLFEIRRSNDNQLPHYINSWADVSPGNMNIKYRGNQYERFRISVNGYVALLDDFNQAIPPIWPNQNNIQARDMINLFYAGTDITAWCGDVYWRISDDKTDIETFGTWVKRASKFSEDGPVIWQPDTVMVVSYEEVDMVWDPCCEALYDEKRSTRDANSSEASASASASADEAARANGTEKRSIHGDDWPHGLNSYQMAIGSRNNGGGSTSTYVIFNYGHIGWVDWDLGEAWSQAGFTQKQKGSIYDSDYSFKQDMYSLGSSGHPRKGVYVFQVDNWGPQCAPGWFILDWDPTENNYGYSNPIC